MKKIIAFGLLLLLLLGLSACTEDQETKDMSKTPAWQEQYDLGVRYLFEGKYEEAILAFNAAIKLDPKRTDTYLGLANVYLAMNDRERAKSVLEDGYAETNDAELGRRLEQIRTETAKGSDETDAPAEEAPDPVPPQDMEESQTLEVSDEQNLVETVQFQWKYIEGSALEYAEISAISSTGDVLWEYVSGEYPGAMVPRISEIGIVDDLYCFVEDGTVIALDVETGEEQWRNGEFGGQSSVHAIDEENLYLCGFFGPSLFVISKSGETVRRLEIEDYNQPYQIDLEGDCAIVVMDGGPDGYEADYRLSIDLDTYEVALMSVFPGEF